jgi:flavin-binding protein dodecin
VAVTKIIEVVGSSPESSDGAVKAALEEARQSLRNIKEWRALVRISFLVERVNE